MLFKAKTVLNEDIRLFKREVKDFGDAFEALKAFIKEKYPINDTPFSIQYEDDENDLITIGTPEDLKEAFEQAQEANRVLKLHVVTEQNAAPKVENEAKEAEKKEDEATDEEGETSHESSSDEEETPLNPYQQLLQDLANNEEFRAEFVNFLTTFVVSVQEGMQGAANEAFKQSLSAHERVQQHPAVAKLAEKLPGLLAQFPHAVLMLSALDAEKIGDYVNMLVQMSNGGMHPDGANQLPPFMATFAMPYLMNLFGGGRFPPHHPPPHHGPPPHHPPFGHPHHGPHGHPPPPHHPMFGGNPFGFDFANGGCPPPPECGFFGGGRRGKCGGRRGWRKWAQQQAQAQCPEKQENEKLGDENADANVNANANANCPFMGPFGGARWGGGCRGGRWKAQGEQDREFGADVVRDDVTVEHRGYVMPGAVIKTWLVKNTGKQDFPAGVKVKYCGPPFNPMIDGVEFDVEPLKVGEQGEVTVMVKAPPEGGLYRSRWRLFLPTGAPFGQILKCHVQVVEDSVAENANANADANANEDVNAEAQVNDEKYENENAHFAAVDEQPKQQDAKDEKALQKLEKQKAKLEKQKAKLDKKIAKESAKEVKREKREKRQAKFQKKQEKKKAKEEAKAVAQENAPSDPSAPSAQSAPVVAENTEVEENKDNKAKEATDEESNPSFVHVDAMEIDAEVEEDAEADGADAMDLASEVDEVDEPDAHHEPVVEIPQDDPVDFSGNIGLDMNWAVEVEAPQFEFQPQLESILSMGFQDSDKVRALLLQHKGDLNVVLNALFAQQ